MGDVCASKISDIAEYFLGNGIKNRRHGDDHVAMADMVWDNFLFLCAFYKKAGGCMEMYVC